MRRRIHACHMGRRIHAWNMRRRIHGCQRVIVCMSFEEEDTCLHVCLESHSRPASYTLCHMRRRIHACMHVSLRTIGAKRGELSHENLDSA
jgi:hypothetical protein